LKNAHLRFGWLTYVKSTEKTTTSIKLRLDRFSKRFCLIHRWSETLPAEDALSSPRRSTLWTALVMLRRTTAGSGDAPWANLDQVNGHAFALGMT